MTPRKRLKSGPSRSLFQNLNAWDLVREQAGKRLSQVSNGLGLGLVLVAGAEEGRVAEGAEGVGQRLRLAAKQAEAHEPPRSPAHFK